METDKGLHGVLAFVSRETTVPRPPFRVKAGSQGNLSISHEDHQQVLSRALTDMTLIVLSRSQEFRESWSFVNAVRKSFKGEQIDVVIDVAGGHGAVAAIFLALYPTMTEAVVIDPAEVQSGRRGLQLAWKEFFEPSRLRYRLECLRTGLPAELEKCRRREKGTILVVACHACQHLTGLGS